jgi:pyruvate/2-oxoglutarate dehydrogenase complex dihydrolipoamide dehydrogenase (E3) component
MSEQATRYDLVAIGGAWALAAASAAARRGERVLVALQPGTTGESQGAAGHWRRALIRRGAHNLYETRRWLLEQRPGTTSHGLETDEAITELVARGSQVTAGHAVFTGHNSVAVHGRDVRFERGLLALEAVEIESPTANNWHCQGDLPARVAVVGDDSKALELAQALARAGCQTHWVAEQLRLADQAGNEAQSLVLAGLGRDGVRTHIGYRVAGDERVGPARIVTIAGAGGQQKLLVDQVICDPPREVKIDRMALAAAGISCESGRIVVDARLRTTNGRIFAIGPACGHEPGAEGALVERFVGGQSARRSSDSANCNIVWTDPQVAHIGRTSGTVGGERIVITQADLGLADADPLRCEAHWRSESGSLAAIIVIAHDAAELATPLSLLLTGALDCDNVVASTLPAGRSGRLLSALAARILALRLQGAGRHEPWWSRTA